MNGKKAWVFAAYSSYILSYISFPLLAKCHFHKVLMTCFGGQATTSSSSSNTFVNHLLSFREIGYQQVLEDYSETSGLEVS